MKKLLLISIFLCPASLLAAEPVNIHKIILDSKRSMSFPEIALRFEPEFDSIAGDDDRITQEELQNSPQMLRMKEKMMQHPTMIGASEAQMAIFQTTVENMTQGILREFDIDQDGFVSKPEYIAKALKSAQKIDKNKDEILSYEEVKKDMEWRAELAKKLQGDMKGLEKSLSELEEKLDDIQNTNQSRMPETVSKN